MEKKEGMVTSVTPAVEEMEGARRATGISSTAALARPRGIGAVPDPEVSAKAARRTFTAEYKRRILLEAAACKEPGQIGAILRREGLYSSNLTSWRRQAEKGTIDALSSRKRGPKACKPDPSTRRITELEKENQTLKARLKKADFIIEAQKKIAEMLHPLDLREEESS